MAGSGRLETRSRLDEHREAWDSLVLLRTPASPFLRSWWIEAVAPAGATFVLVHDHDRLVGGVAVQERRFGGVRRYGAPGPTVLCPDHLDLLAEPAHEEAVVAAVASWFARPGNRLLDIRGVADDGLLARAVGTGSERSDVAPYQELPGRTTYLETRSANFRRSVRRAGRRLADGGFEHRRVQQADLSAAFDAFRSLQEDRPGRGPLLAELPALRRALSAGVARGEARVDVLASGPEVIAVSLAFVVAGRLSLYQVARSLDDAHDGAGNVLLVAVIEDARASGCVEVDLLRGDEAYKTSFADRTRTVHRLRAAHGPAGRAQLAAEDVARRVSARLRSRVP